MKQLLLLPTSSLPIYPNAPAMCTPGGGGHGKAGALGACEFLVQSRLQVAQWGVCVCQHRGGGSVDWAMGGNQANFVSSHKRLMVSL